MKAKKVKDLQCVCLKSEENNNMKLVTLWKTYILHL